MIVNRHSKHLKQIDWKDQIRGEHNLSEGEMKGFKGLSNWVKRHYRYSELNWGKGGKSGDNTWSQRWYKEMQN